jgi:pimeloyl-ACP methyl ester carboxylesterase
MARFYARHRKKACKPRRAEVVEFALHLARESRVEQQPARAGIVRVRGVQLRHAVYGEDGPWVTLTSGGRRGFDELEPLAARIAAEGFRVLLHDRRNTGASDIVIDGDDGEEEIWADDLAALLAQLGVDRAFIAGTSSGARMSVIVNRRHPALVRGLVLVRVTGGPVAAGRLPHKYYGEFIEAARAGGMAAVCATPEYEERIRANPGNRDRLLAMDPRRYIAVMTRWLDVFLSGPREPMLGVTVEELQAIRVPTLVVPGNDNTHGLAGGKAVAALIPGAQLELLPVEEQDVAVLPLSAWAGVEHLLARHIVDFMRRH